MEYNGVELSPCIVAKAKEALNVPNRTVGNKKTCTLEYWVNALKAVAQAYSIPDYEVARAVGEYDHYFR
jgi:hypothetical protein